MLGGLASVCCWLWREEEVAAREENCAVAAALKPLVGHTGEK